MALAETPDHANERLKRELAQTNPEQEESAQPAFGDPGELSEGLRRGIVKEGEARDSSHPSVRHLRNVMRGWNTRGYVKVLTVLEVVCSTDRAFENARRQVLQLMNAQEREMVEIINRLAGPPQVKAKEKGNGDGR